MNETTAIFLAACLSRRMGAQNKLLLLIYGVPIIRHISRQYQAATDGPVLVVLGHQADLVQAALRGTGVYTVFNADFAEGQYTSVATGFRNAVDTKTVLIGLGDQPLLQYRDVLVLLTVHYCADQGKISIPVNGKARGHPLIVPRSLRAKLSADSNAPDCRKFKRTNPDLAQELALRARRLFVDVDTLEAYQAGVLRMQVVAA